uniref:Uncharacterized protein n=1 Tax=Glossina pallidipes TaxID=7398 RepID=A0A1A9ZV09_GLOPL
MQKNNNQLEEEHHLLLHSILTRSGDQGGSVTIAETFGSEIFTIAGLATSLSGPSQAMIESSVLVQSRHLKHFLCHSRPLDRTSSAANTTPPQRGQPSPGRALILLTSITPARGACYNMTN